MSQEIRYNLTTIPTPDDMIRQELQQIVNGQIETLSRWIVNTRDEGIRASLIQLGWTPPPGPEIKESLAYE